MPNHAIEIQNLTVRFGRLTAVDHLNLEVEKGTIFGFLGENGAGKTTTIRVLMGLLRPSEGGVKVLGETPLGGNPKLLQRIGYVSDDRSMYRWMKVREALRFNAGLFRNGTTPMQNRCFSISNSTQTRRSSNSHAGRSPNWRSFARSPRDLNC